jgi:hypothetical protein
MTGRLGHQGRGTPKQGGEQTHQDGTIQTGFGSGTGSHTKGQGHGERDHGRRDATENITTHIIEIDDVEYLHNGQLYRRIWRVFSTMRYVDRLLLNRETAIRGIHRTS